MSTGTFYGVRGPGGTGHRNPAYGFHCPECGSGRHKTSDSRQSGTCRLRTYTCLDCDIRFKTVEIQGPRNPKNGVLALQVLQQELLETTSTNDILNELRRRIQEQERTESV